MDYKIRIIKKEDYKVSTWSGGKTREMFIYPPEADYKRKDFYWRVSSASVELPESDFTKLEGINRFITSLDNDLKLTHNYKDFIELKPFEVYKFNGGEPTHSYGKVEDFNLMIGNGARGELKSVVLDNVEDIYISNDSNENSFNLFYSRDEDIFIEIKHKETILKKEDLLILEVEPHCKIDVRLNTSYKTHILYMDLYIE